MSLLIACLLIYHMNLPGWWYVIAAVIWLFGPGEGIGLTRRWNP